MELTFAAAALSALGHQTRLAIYRRLVRSGPEGEAAGHIGAALRLAPATLSFHLRELSHAGLVCARQQSRFIYYSADVAAFGGLMAFLAEDCGPVEGASHRAPSEPPRTSSPAAKPVVHPKTRVA